MNFFIIYFHSLKNCVFMLCENKGIANIQTLEWKGSTRVWERRRREKGHYRRDIHTIMLVRIVDFGVLNGRGIRFLDVLLDIQYIINVLDWCVCHFENEAVILASWFSSARLDSTRRPSIILRIQYVCE